MDKQLKHLMELAEAHGVTVDDLLAEKELGLDVSKPFTLAITFPRLKELLEFAKDFTSESVWKADVLDHEFGGKGGKNAFVLRGDDPGKPEEMRVTLKKPKHPVCPRCEGHIPNNDTPGAYPGAISRLDNKTEICSDCGVEEALLDYAGELQDWRP